MLLAQTAGIEEPSPKEVEPLPAPEVEVESILVTEVTHPVVEVVVDAVDPVSSEAVEDAAIVPTVTVTPEFEEAKAPEPTVENVSEPIVTEDESKEVCFFAELVHNSD